MSTHHAGELGDELLAVTAALRRVIRRQLRPNITGTPLRGSHVELLQIIERHPGISIASAAGRLYLASNSVSTIVNELMQAGMVQRETDPADRRSARLALTEAATSRLAGWRAARAELIAGGMQALSDTQRNQLAAALPALHSLVTTLGESEEA